MKEKMDKEAFRLYPTFVQDREIYRRGFEAGYDCANEELEKNRLTACDNMTEKEAEREQRFIINFLEKNSRTPTFSDCVEITRREMIDKACKHINDHWDKLLVYDYNQYGGCVFNRQKTVEQFKQALEE